MSTDESDHDHCIRLQLSFSNRPAGKFRTECHRLPHSLLACFIKTYCRVQLRVTDRLELMLMFFVCANPDDGWLFTSLLGRTNMAHLLT